jgi:hypothetical protein
MHALKPLRGNSLRAGVYELAPKGSGYSSESCWGERLVLSLSTSCMIGHIYLTNVKGFCIACPA